MSTDFNLSRLGVSDGSTDGSFAQDNSLFRKLYLAEVATAYYTNTIMRGLHMTREIDSGKSASFPATWKTSAQYHTPGKELTGNNEVKHAERVINVDDLLESDIMIYQIDEAKNHYDVRSIYSEAQGKALAEEYDRNVLRVLINASRVSAADARFADESDVAGSKVSVANALTDADALEGLIWQTAETLDLKNVPDGDRHIVLGPSQFYLLFQAGNSSGRRWVLERDIGATGSYAQGVIPDIAGFTIHKSPHCRKEKLATDQGDGTWTYTNPSGVNNDYSLADMANFAGIAFSRQAAGTVQLRDLSLEQEYLINYQGTLSVAKYVVGHGILRPECAVELATE